MDQITEKRKVLIVEFKPEEIKNLFEELSKMYYNRNFGSAPKSDIDVLMFSVYIEHCIDSSRLYDDYTLSKELGITQTRIRTLKEKKELKYPRKGFKWEEAFARELINAKYDKNTNNIKMIIQDINVMNEVRNYIEQKGWYDECSLNKKLLVISLDCFVEICFKNEDFEQVFSENVKDNIKKLKRSDSAIKEFLSDFTKDGIKNLLVNGTSNIIAQIIGCIPGIGSTLKMLLEHFVKIKEKN